MANELDYYEKLGIFYLGEKVDPKSLKKNGELFLYKSKHLTTHAAIIGMTGSGKTGLGIDIIEEAAIDNIPSIIIDPKGDMGNLLLTFPKLEAENFEEWIDKHEASNRGLSPLDYAKQTAKMWEEGIESWHQDKSRIEKLKKSADFTIYTPGSTAGIPLSVLSSFEAPSEEILQDPDAFSAMLNSVVSSILTLIDIDADPLLSPEYMLLASIFSYFWKEKKDLSLEEIIGYISSPPFDKIGVLPLKSFYPQNERLKLAMLLNNVLASPGFSAWIEGEKLDIQKLLYDEDAKPRVSILSIAHLNDQQRMFFVTLFLNKYIDWMRRQSGTPTLRTVLYMDEIFGFFPATSKPPSKEPMLLLLKQARAYGIGVVLATQNPIDLDYKGLSNIGSWFLGRLQTKQDKERVIDGLISSNSASLDKREIEELLSSIKSRTFLFKSAKEDDLTLFETRWVLSYLRGPITKQEIKKLMSDKKRRLKEEPKQEQKNNSSLEGLLKAPPILHEDIESYYLNLSPHNQEPVYEPFMIFNAVVRFYNNSRGIDIESEYAFKIYLDERMNEFDFSELEEKEGEDKERCDKKPLKNASFYPLPSFISSSTFKEMKKEFSDFLYYNKKLELYRNRKLKIESNPDETLADFKIKIQEILKKRYEDEIEKLKEKYEEKEQKLGKRLRRAEDKLEKEQDDVTARTTDTILGFGMTLLDAFLGRKTIKRSTATRAAGSLRSAGRVFKEKEDVKRAEEEVKSIEEEIRKLDDELKEEIDSLEEKYNIENYEIETFYIKPRRSDIYDIDLFLCWESR